VFVWYRLDAEERGYPRSPLLNVGVIAITVLALPYYLFRTRRFPRGLYATVAFLALGVAYSLLQYAGAYAVYFGHRFGFH